MHTIPIMDNRPMPLPTDQNWLKKFNAAVGSSDKDDHNCLAKDMKLNYCGGVGELIWAMTTCHPDLDYTSIKLSQSNSCPHEHHYHAFATHSDNSIKRKTMGYISGKLPHAWNYLLVPFHRSTAIARTSYLTLLARTSMLQPDISIWILTGLHV
jgi:hypothetical protein